MKTNNFVNPYFPNRKIRHAKLLTTAGFKINLNWYKDENGGIGQRKGSNPNPTSCSKLIYWKRGDINLVFFDYDKVSLKRLVNQIENQVIYNQKKKAYVQFRD